MQNTQIDASGLNVNFICDYPAKEWPCFVPLSWYSNQNLNETVKVWPEKVHNRQPGSTNESSTIEHIPLVKPAVNNSSSIEPH